MRILLVMLTGLALLPPLRGQDPPLWEEDWAERLRWEPAPHPAPHPAPPNSFTPAWTARRGRSYPVHSGPRHFIRLRYSPVGPDWDDDRVGNADELLRGTDPLEGSSRNGDNLPDDWEIFAYGTSAGGGGWDFDSDGLSDSAEFTAGTDPGSADTDGDGIADGEDAAPTDKNRTGIPGMLHYTAIDLSTPLIGNQPLWRAAINDDLEIAVGYETERTGSGQQLPGAVQNIVVSTAASAVNSRREYFGQPLELAADPTWIYLTFLNARGAIAGRATISGQDPGPPPLHTHTGNYNPAFVWSRNFSFPAPSSPEFFQGIHLSEDEEEFHQWETDLWELRNSGRSWGTMSLIRYGWSGNPEEVVYQEDFIKPPGADPELMGDLEIQMINDFDIAVGHKSFGTNFTFSSNVIRVGPLTRGIFFPGTGEADRSTNVFAMSNAPMGEPVGRTFRLMGFSSLLTPVPMPHLPPAARHPFIREEMGAPVDAYTLLGDYQSRFAFTLSSSAPSITAQFSSRGDLLFDANIRENPGVIAPTARRSTFLWHRASSTIDEITLPDLVTNPDPDFPFSTDTAFRPRLLNNRLIFGTYPTPKRTHTGQIIYEPNGDSIPIHRAFLLLPIEIQVRRPQNMDGDWAASGKVIDNLLSVWDTHANGKDWIEVKVVLPTAFAQNLPEGFIKWTVQGVVTPIPDNTLETPQLRWPGGFGVKKITIDFPMARLRKVLYVDVPNIGTDDTAAVVARWKAADRFIGFFQEKYARGYGLTADQWSKGLPGLKPSHRNALKHAYWMALCASDTANSLGSVRALEYGIAYEVNDKLTNNPANEATMDVYNDRVGAAIVFSDAIGEPNYTRIQTELDQKRNAGELMIWDGPSDEHRPASLDLLIKSNDQKYYPSEETY